jgi:DNA (cytosine-5)-methyltransferase 1
VKHLDLFSGIGGFSLAARWAGWQTIGFCEKDDYCRKVLAKHWPAVPIIEDIHDVTIESFRERPDIITGGFPCQPFSIAGKREGVRDDRHLWPEMYRVIKAFRPRWVVAENVAHIVKMELDNVLADLEAAGYSAWPVEIPACAVDAPHRRMRVWVIAYRAGSQQQGNQARVLCQCQRSAAAAGREDLRQPDGKASTEQFRSNGQDVADSECAERRPEPEARLALSHGSNDGREEATGGFELCGENVADSNGGNGHGRACDVQMGRREIEGETSDNGNAGRTQRLAEPGMGGTLDGLSPWMDGDWERGIPRIASGIANRIHRLRGLGNAIVPQVAYEIFRAIDAVTD